MKTNKKIGSRAGVVSELFSYLWQRKLYWLIPMVVLLVTIGLLLVLASVASPISPFIYTLF
jgi:hypothetical protein